MPFFNLFKNCGYYWLFTAYVAYHVNHPKYTSPSDAYIYGGLALFVVSFAILTPFCPGGYDFLITEDIT